MLSDDRIRSLDMPINGCIDKHARKATVVPIARGRRHIEALDGIRGVAVILVLAVHFNNLAVLPQKAAMSRWVAGAISWGWCGVDLFFVLSGFLITGILLNTKNSEKRFRSFYARRSLRILPLYYAIVLLSIAACLFLRHSHPNNTFGPTLIGWVAYLAYLQNWWIPFGNLHHMEFLGPLWSLAIEEQFYLIWPFCVWRLSTNLLARICGFGVLGAVVLRWWLTSHAVSGLDSVVYMNTLTRMDGLLAGAFCAIVVRNPALLERAQKVKRVIVVTVLSGLAIIFLRGHQAWNDPEALIYGHVLFAIGFGCFVLSAYLFDGSTTLFDRVFRSKVLTLFGKYSYGIYVYQGFVLELTLHFFRYRPWWGHSIPYALMVALAWTTVPFFIAFLSYNLFEAKFLRLKQSFPPSGLGLRET